MCRTDGTHFQRSDVTSRKTLVSTFSLVRHDIDVSVRFVTLLQTNKYQAFYRRVGNIAKSDYRLRHVCLPPCPSVRPSAWHNSASAGQTPKHIKEKKTRERKESQLRI